MRVEFVDLTHQFGCHAEHGDLSWPDHCRHATHGGRDILKVTAQHMKS
jgi:hypothetical protein